MNGADSLPADLTANCSLVNALLSKDFDINIISKRSTLLLQVTDLLDCLIRNNTCQLKQDLLGISNPPLLPFKPLPVLLLFDIIKLIMMQCSMATIQEGTAPEPPSSYAGIYRSRLRTMSVNARFSYQALALVTAQEVSLSSPPP